MRHLQSNDSASKNDSLLFEIIFVILVVFLGLTVLYILCKLRRILFTKRYSNRQAVEENQEYVSRQDSKKNKGSKRVNTQPLTQTENENQKSLNKVKPNSDPQLEKRNIIIKQQDQLNEEVIHQENEKSREHLDTSVHKNFFAIDQEDFDAQHDVHNLDQVKNPMEYSEHNLSNVFNLEGEDFSQRQYQKKKIKDKKGNASNYQVVNVNQF